VGIQGQLARNDERRDEDDPSAAIGGEPAGEIERVLRLLLLEQGHEDAPVGDRACPPRETACAAVERADVREPHLKS
jgi:hypothetical protein